MEFFSVPPISLGNFRARASEWAGKNRWAVGVAEMALGASLLAWGIQNGAIDMGTQIVGSALSTLPSGGVLGALTGAGIGPIAAAYVGSIGLAAMGSAVAVPAVLLAGAGAAVFSAFGYTVGDVAESFLEPQFSDLLGPGSALLIGVALLVDGSRRLITDKAVLGLVAQFKDGVLQLPRVSGTILASSLSELQSIKKAMFSLPENAVDATGSAVTGLAAGAAGTAAGAAVAAGTVTVLGSSTLGSAAIAMGLVSAPLWPVIAGGAAGLAAGYFVWKSARHMMLKSPKKQPNS